MQCVMLTLEEELYILNEILKLNSLWILVGSLLLVLTGRR